MQKFTNHLYKEYFQGCLRQKCIVSMFEVMEMITNNFLPLTQVGQFHKYTILKEIGSGSCGKVYEGKDQIDEKRSVVVKIQFQNVPSMQIIHQCNIYRILRPHKKQSNIRIPQVYYCAQEYTYNVLVLQKLGPSLDSILKYWNGKLPLKTVLLFAEQMISLLEYIHSKHIIHRDLKPQNFCMGTGQDKDKIFMIDFGIAKKYIYKGADHIAMKKVNYLFGNPIYASINTHHRLQQSRRDDLQGLAYILIDFAKGTLPWKKKYFQTQCRIRQQTILYMKENSTAKLLCKGLPQSFCIFLQSVRNLKFTQEPNYEFYKNLFRLTFKIQKYNNDNFEIYQRCP